MHCPTREKVGSTSMPSKRVFLDCGLALTTKRLRLKGNVQQDQVMIHGNDHCLTITENYI